MFSKIHKMKVKPINEPNRMFATFFFNKEGKFKTGRREKTGALLSRCYFFPLSAICSPDKLLIPCSGSEVRGSRSPDQTDPPLKTSEVAPATTAAPPCSRRPFHSFARWRRLRAKISLRKFAEKWGVTPVLRPRSSLGPGPKGRNGSIITTTSTGSQQKLSNLSESR